MTQAVTQPTVTADEARAMTEDVRADARALWRKVLDLYEAGVHLALGYPSWNTYWSAEFGQSGSRGDQLVRAGRVVRALEAAEVEVLPRNDHLAGELIPVFRVAPQDLPDVWTRAVELGKGQPTRHHIAQVVEPYRRRRHGGPAAGEAGRTKARRARAGVPIIQARANAGEAAANIDAALDVDMATEVMAEWLEHADAGAALLREVADKISVAIQSRDGKPAKKTRR